MARNVERDAREAERRRNQLIEAGFRLFSSKGIEIVSLQSVADEAHVGIATVYNYYKNKENLLVAISAYMWRSVYDAAFEKLGEDTRDRMNAYQMLEYYIDHIISIYHEHPEILKFSSDYKTYICRKGISGIGVEKQLSALAPLNNLFHEKYEKAKTDGSIRTDIPENQLFTTVAITMLGMSERYAQGLVWAMEDSNDYSRELSYLKEMLLMWVKG